MSTITTRSGKGSPLTNAEVDSNFTNLNADKLEVTDLSDYVTQNVADASYEPKLTNTTRMKFFRRDDAPAAVPDDLREGDMWYETDTENIYFWREISSNTYNWVLFSTGTTNSDTMDGGAY